jgi:hypothetical protein
LPLGQSKVELYAALRRDAREGMSNRALERKYRVGRRTVQTALSSAWPQPREPYAPRRSKLDPFKPVIDQMLLADLDAPRKQRHTDPFRWITALPPRRSSLSMGGGTSALKIGSIQHCGCR